ncbi:MAG TPA: sodium:proton antiporter [Polyangiaceae bacterium]
MPFELLVLVVGALLIVMALSGSVLKRLPLSTSLFYLAVGVVLGPECAGLIRVDFVRDAPWLERVTELAVLLSLFTAGMKLRSRNKDAAWTMPLRLASASMVLTIAALTLVGYFLLKLPLGAAVLLGAVLAPTDPVLASDVQVEHAGDRDRLRFALTGEAGLNDGTAFPFVMLGLGLLALHPLGNLALRWIGVDLLWAVAAGLGVGAALGTGLGRLVVYLRSHHKEAVGLEEFVTLGLIALSYGAALLLHAYAFLAVFAAGLSLRRIERKGSDEDVPGNVLLEQSADEVHEVATAPEHAPAYLVQTVLSFNEQLERVAEVALVLLLGALLRWEYFSLPVLASAGVLLLVIRPAAVVLGLIGTERSQSQTWLVSWFGIRGIGSMYYLAFAVQHGLPPHLAEQLTAVTLVVVASSIVLHGISVTPFMSLYAKRRTGDSARA